MSKKQKHKVYFISKLSVLLVLFAMIFKPSGSLIYATQTMTETKIMPLGDSITDCDFWRTLLFTRLVNDGYSIKSVGMQNGNHEGHSGMCVTNLAATNQLTTWLDATNPDIVMMHFGTNDCWGNAGTAKILDAYTKLVAQMRENNPKMTIVVAQIIPMHPNDTLDYEAIIVDLNSAMVEWANNLSTSESPILLCDQYTGFDTDIDTYDGVHPNTSGGQKMCDRWYQTLTKILNREPISEPTPTPIPTPEATPTPTPEATPTPTPMPTEGGLKLDTVVSAWNTGYTMTVNITNTSNTNANEWKLIVNKDDFDISNIWCAQMTESGEHLIITPMSWNSVINAGSTVSFGFQGVATAPVTFSYTLE